MNIGETIAGKYRVEGLLGQSGNGIVFKVRHIQLDELRALKCMATFGDSPGTFERFSHEARAAARLRSEHAVKIYDVDKLEDGAPYIVMEHLVGNDLSVVLKESGTQPVEKAVVYLLQACHAIAEAHASGIVHRDIKPANLFLSTRTDGSPCVKVLDFGLAKISPGDGHPIRPAKLIGDDASKSPFAIPADDELVGTPLYMSPEQWLRANVDARADVWALGVVLYEMLTGHVPFRGGSTIHELCAAVLKSEPTPPSSLRPDLPENLEQLILSCLKKDASQRPSVDDLARELLPFAPRSAPLPPEWPMARASSRQAAPDASALRPGDIIAGKYRVEHLLGEGGMGIVVAATHIDLDELRAIKLMKPEGMRNPSLVERFKRESRAAACLRSEHAAKVHDVGSLESGTPFIVMEHLVGSDLHMLLRRFGAQPIETAVLYVMQACDAIAEAHAAGIVHRDLKPGNLFLTLRTNGSPCIKVLDFGLSKAGSKAPSTPAPALTQSADVMGTPYYMSPEQMRATRGADARTDIWALGVILYELITGSRPFGAPTLPEVFAMVLHESVKAPSALRPGIPPEVEAVILRCLEKDPDRRISSALELARLLAPFGPPGAPVPSAANVPERSESSPFIADADTLPAHLLSDTLDALRSSDALPRSPDAPLADQILKSSLPSSDEVMSTLTAPRELNAKADPDRDEC